MYEARSKKNCWEEQQKFPPKTLDIDTLYIIRLQTGLFSLLSSPGWGSCVIREPAVLCADFLRKNPGSRYSENTFHFTGSVSGSAWQNVLWLFQFLSGRDGLTRTLGHVDGWE